MRILLASILFTGSAFAQLCGVTVTPVSLNVGADPSDQQVDVTTTCGWTAMSSATWLKITSGPSYTGNGILTFSVDANPAGFPRVGKLIVAGKEVTVTQSATSCSFAINPKVGTVPVTGATGSFAVSANCAWQAISNNGDFLTVPYTLGNGDGTVNYTAAARGCVAGRTGTIRIETGLPSPPVFTLTQDGSPDNLTLSAITATAGGDAGEGRVLVNTGNGCAWSAFSDVSWMQITAGASGSGNGPITYRLLANSTGPRTGSIHVGDRTFTVTQAALAAAPKLTGVTSGGSYRADAISPGEIVSLFGSNMGPGELVGLDVKNGFLTTTLAGTRVLFDGVAAPLIYTLDRQVSVVAPYGIAGKSSTQVQVVYNGVVSNTMTMPVQSAHPAIFTQDATGAGAGSILNQDYSLNTATNGAARGSVVAIYATGGGTTDPALADGAITGSDLPYLTQFRAQRVNVKIGGIDARVTYAGGVPTAVAGLTQINAEVPAGVTPGPNLPVVVTIAGYTSASGVTISVK